MIGGNNLGIKKQDNLKNGFNSIDNKSEVEKNDSNLVTKSENETITSERIAENFSNNIGNVNLYESESNKNSDFKVDSNKNIGKNTTIDLCNLNDNNENDITYGNNIRYENPYNSYKIANPNVEINPYGNATIINLCDINDNLNEKDIVENNNNCKIDIKENDKENIKIIEINKKDKEKVEEINQIKIDISDISDTEPDEIRERGLPEDDISELSNKKKTNSSKHSKHNKHKHSNSYYSDDDDDYSDSHKHSKHSKHKHSDSYYSDDDYKDSRKHSRHKHSDSYYSDDDDDYSDSHKHKHSKHSKHKHSDSYYSDDDYKDSRKHSRHKHSDSYYSDDDDDYSDSHKHSKHSKHKHSDSYYSDDDYKDSRKHSRHKHSDSYYSDDDYKSSRKNSKHKHSDSYYSDDDDYTDSHKHSKNSNNQKNTNYSNLTTNIQQTKPKRIFWVDWLRIFSSVLIVYSQSSGVSLKPKKFGSSNWSSLLVYNSLSKPCTPLFLMMSSMLLLNPEKELTYKKIISKYFTRALKCYAIWSIYYNTFNTYIINFDKTKYTWSWEQVGKTLLNIITASSGEHMWYLKIIMALYIVTPIFRKLTRNKNLAWYITLALIGITQFLPTTLEFSFNDIVKKIKDPIEKIGGVVVYYLLGYLLNSHTFSKKLYVRCCYYIGLAGSLLTIGLRFYAAYVEKKDNNDFAQFSDLNIGMAATGIFMFFKHTLAERINNIMERTFVNKIIISLSECSFGVYLIHMTVYHFFSRFDFHTQSLNPAYWTIIYTTILYLVSYIIIFLMRKVPILRAIT